jgi:SpoVK/Ycf46/Vps4 family AAA+-type ATPase
VEQVVISMFTEVRRHKPSVVFIPQIEQWYATLGETALTTLSSMLQSLPPTDPVLLLATTDMEVEELDKAIVRGLFSYSRKNRVVIARPTFVSTICPRSTR